MQKAGHFDGRCTDDDVGNTQIKVALYGFQIADTATQLNRHIRAHGLNDALHSSFILGLAGKGAVQIDKMQTSGALCQPMLRRSGRIF